MLELTLSQLRRFHSDLRTLADAGLPVLLDGMPQPKLHQSGATNESPATARQTLQLQRLENIETQLRDMLHIAHKSGLKHDLRSEETMLRGALEQPHFATHRYRKCLDAWLQCDGDPRTMTPVVFQPLIAEESARWRSIGILPLVVWFTVGYGVFAFISLFVFPQVLSLANQIQYTSPVFAAIEQLVRYRTLGLILTPVLGVLILWALSRSQRSQARSHPASWTAQYLASSQVARLLAHQTPLPEALGLGLPYTEEPTTQAQEQTLSTDTITLSPLLQWAKQEGERNGRNAYASFDFASHVYRGLGRLTAERSDRRPVNRLALFLGTAIALFIGLSLFVPVIELLWYSTSSQSVQ